jgi:hypothetical protein
MAEDRGSGHELHDEIPTDPISMPRPLKQSARERIGCAAYSRYRQQSGGGVIGYPLWTSITPQMREVWIQVGLAAHDEACWLVRDLLQ